jgi:hypothetical protein
MNEFNASCSVTPKMFDEFMRRLAPGPDDTVLDVGVTSDQSIQARIISRLSTLSRRESPPPD